MISGGIREQLLFYIERTVTAQFVIISCLAVWIIFLLAWRRNNEKILKYLENLYSDLIVNDLIQTDIENAYGTTLYKPKWYQVYKKIAYRHSLLNQIDAISGKEKAYLIHQYCKLGFAAEDKELSYSIFWWRRLHSISNLSRLDILAYAPVFERLRKDSHSLVVGAATIALSQLKHDLNRIEILHSIKGKALKRQNLLLKVTSNWAQVHGYQFILNNLEKEKSQLLIKIYVMTLVELNEPEAGQALVKYLLEKDRIHQIDVLVKVIRTLKNIGDPLYLPIAENYINHQDPHIRAEALEMLIRLDRQNSEAALALLKDDPSNEVQRILRQVQERKVK